MNNRKIKNILVAVLLVLILATISMLFFLNILNGRIYTNNHKENNIETEENGLLEEPVKEIEYNLGEDGWKTYHNQNYGFKIEIPKDWVTNESDNFISFGTVSSMVGGGVWGVSVYQRSDEILDKQVNNIIADFGRQFEDRKETRSVINDFTTKVIVTTNKKDDWFSETYLFVSDKNIYVISNGAVKNKEFELFFDSFEIN